MNKFTGILTILSKAPPGSHAQIDETVCTRLASMAEADSFSAEDMKKILDDCAYSSLASDFAMKAMHLVWQQMLSSEVAK